MAHLSAPDPLAGYDGFHPESLVLDLHARAQDLRRTVVDMVVGAGSGHCGGSLSAADIIAALYFHQLRIDPANPNAPDRDWFILSKGHAAPLLYAALAKRGFFPEAELTTLRQLDSRLQGHPDRNKTPGVDMTAGSLGHGVSIGVGLALAARMQGSPSQTYVLLGDGEIQAGIVWEGLMAASKYNLDNLTAILDFNGVQLDGMVDAVMPLEPVVDKWKSFGWQVIEIDGHNMRQILEALDEVPKRHGKPTVIIAHTIKGKGVSYMENKNAWHGKTPTKEQHEQAVAELTGSEVRRG
jgi:transketolase